MPDLRTHITETVLAKLSVGDSHPTASDWTVTELTNEKMIFYNNAGTQEYCVELVQRGKRASDLPFKAVRVTPNSDRYQLSEGDFIDEVYPALEAYMLGFQEHEEVL